MSIGTKHSANNLVFRNQAIEKCASYGGIVATAPTNDIRVEYFIEKIFFHQQKLWQFSEICEEHGPNREQHPPGGRGQRGGGGVAVVRRQRLGLGQLEGGGAQRGDRGQLPAD